MTATHCKIIEIDAVCPQCCGRVLYIYKSSHLVASSAARHGRHAGLPHLETQRDRAVGTCTWLGDIYLLWLPFQAFLHYLHRCFIRRYGIYRKTWVDLSSISVADGGGGVGGLNHPLGWFFCSSVWKLQRTCLFGAPEPPFKNSWTRPYILQFTGTQ